MSRRLLVLGWHNVEPTAAFPGSARSVARFERQLRLLRRWTNVLPLAQALDDLSAGRRLPPRAVALSFDDGYLDNATVAAPMLRALGLPATFFLVTGFLSGTEACWWEDLAAAVAATSRTTLRWDGRDLDLTTGAAREAARTAIERGVKTLDTATRRAAVDEITGALCAGTGPQSAALFMGWEQARALASDGFEIGSHTVSHPVLSTEAPTEQVHQLTASKTTLETELGRPVELLAYPNGRACDYDAGTAAIAEGAGYRHAVTTRAGVARAGDPAYDVRRHVVGPEDDVARVLLDVARAARSRRRHGGAVP